MVRCADQEGMGERSSVDGTLRQAVSEIGLSVKHKGDLKRDG